MARSENWPGIRPVSGGDLIEAIGAGVRDFKAAPKYGLLVGLLYAAAGWMLVTLLWHFKMLYLAYPLAMGFALLAPFTSVVFYAVSDLLERGELLSWGKVLGAVRQSAGRELRWMALVTGFALVLWMDIAAFLMFAFVGFDGFGPDLLSRLLTTPSGLFFLVLGNLIGALIALAVFSISVVSFPMLYDRDTDFVTAMVTSVRLVAKNPIVLSAWCALLGFLTGLSILSAFLGLIVFLPIAGHASWHLYRRAVEPAPKTAAAAAGAGALETHAG